MNADSNTEWLETLPTVIASLGTPDFPEALIGLIQSVAPCDSTVIMAYPEGGELNVVHNALHAGDQPGFSGPYRDGLWLLSPLYLGAKAGRRGFFHILDIAPPNFAKSDYYDLYYQSNGVHDQAVYLAASGDGTPVAISLERTPQLSIFTPDELQALGLLSATIAELMCQQWPAGLGDGETAKPFLHLQVEQILQQFGCTVLTPREREVVQLILKGLPSKVIARELGISAQTEQVHRKNIYQKLGLSSHNELFSLFFAALGQPFPEGTDPLVELLPAGTT